jgi:opacity protein-like surface antigen
MFSKLYGIEIALSRLIFGLLQKRDALPQVQSRKAAPPATAGGHCKIITTKVRRSKMKNNKLLGLALAAVSVAALPAASFAADNNGNGGFFVNGNVGQSNLDKGLYNDNDTGYGVNAGYRWTINPALALGVEGGYTDLGKFDNNGSVREIGVSRATVKGWTAGVNAHYNITPQWYVSGRAGLFNANVKGFTSPLALNYVDDSDTKYYAGAGFGYDFSNNLSVGVNYDYYKAKVDGLNFDPSLVSVSAEYRF